ncbi:MAG TPA: PEGA domain-containing protein [archaeon]|nr:PEGA domain-containing protein [archaeon]
MRRMQTSNLRKSAILNAIFAISFVLLLSGIGFSANLTGNVSITTVPAGAYVYADVHPATTWSSPAKFRLPVGNQSIRIEKVGYAPYTGVVEILAGKTTALNISLTAGPTGNLTVYTIPSGASVSIYAQGKYFIASRTSSFTVPLNPGNYTAKISKGNYESYTTSFIITQNARTKLQIALKVLTGNLSITSAPSGAKVYRNGIYLSNTPYNQVTIVGNYSIRLDLDGYASYNNATVQIFPGVKTAINAKLMPLNIPTTTTTLPPVNTTTTTVPTTTTTIPLSGTGNLSIAVSPTASYAYIDGVMYPYYLAPLTIYNLAAGTHSVMLEKLGYLTTTRSVEITGGRTTALNVMLSALPNFKGNLSFITSPAGAAVYVDRAFRGSSPVTVYNLTVGNYTVSVMKLGYTDLNFRTEVFKGITGILNLTLTLMPPPTNGTLIVSSIPTGATVYVNSLNAGLTTLNVSLLSGNYSVMVQKAGYVSQNRTAEILRGGVLRLSFNLTAVSVAGMATAK